MERYDSNLFDFFRSCNTYDHKSRTIDVSDLQYLCIEYRLSLRDCKDCIKIDASQRVPFSEIMRYIRDYVYRESNGPSTHATMHPIQHTYSPIYRPYLEDSYTPEYSSEDPFRGGDIPVSPPDQDSHDPPLIPREMHWVAADHHHHQTSSRASPSGLPPSNGEVRMPSDPSWYQNDSDDYTKGRHCRNCKSYQRQCYTLKDKLKLAKAEIEHLHTLSDKTSKELQQYYQKHWQKQAKEYEGYLAASERDRLKLQAQIEKITRSYRDKLDTYQKALREKDRSTRRLQQDEGDSDTSSRGHPKGYHDDGKRLKDELDMERLQRMCSSLKQENEQLKEQLRETEREKWSLKDENQKLHCQLIKGDPLLAKGVQPIHKTPSTECDPERQQEREVQPGTKKQPKSLISAPSEASDIYTSSGYLPNSIDGVSNIVSILNEDVTTSVLPESFSPEQQQQLVYALQNCHSIQELITCIFSYSLSFSASSQEGLVENEQLRSKVKHLEAEYRRLSTSFETVKQESEYMFCKLAQVEGNNCCLRHITKLCQQACEVHELLYEMKLSPTTSTSPTFPSFPDSNYSGDRNGLGKHVLLRVRCILSDLETNKELQSHIPTQPSDGFLSGWNLSMSQYTATTSGLSSGVSSIGEAELNSNEIDQLKIYYQGLVSYASQLIGTLVEVDGLRELMSVKDPNIVKDSLFDKNKMEQAVADIEDYVDTEELCKIREEKAELRSQIYMMEQSKRSMELQVSRVQLQNNMLERRNAELQQLYKTEKDKRRRIRDKLKLYKSQADISNIPDNTSEAQQALDRALLHSEELYHFLQKHIQESQEISDQLVEFVKELLSANRALVEAFERAKKRQQFEKRQWKQDILALNNRLHQST